MAETSRAALSLFDGIAELARIGLPGFGPDQRHLAAGLAQAINGIPDFHFLILLLDQDGGAFALQFHIDSCREVGVSLFAGNWHVASF